MPYDMKVTFDRIARSRSQNIDFMANVATTNAPAASPNTSIALILVMTVVRNSNISLFLKYSMGRFHDAESTVFA